MHAMKDGSVRESGTLELILRLAAPYLAVAVFWCGFSSAWPAILAYHAQILLWSRHAIRPRLGAVQGRYLLLAAPAVLAGPFVYWLLPFIARVPLSGWLAEHGLPSTGLLLMIPYFGLVHPWLEQAHWAPLRERTPLAHALFAGYHLLVLGSLLPWPWLVAVFLALAGTSFGWTLVTRRTGSPAVALASHMAADLGIVAAAWLAARV